MSMLQQIESEYVDWVQESRKNTDKMYIDLKTDFNQLNKDILDSEVSDSDVKKSIAKLRKKLLYSNLVYSEYKLNRPVPQTETERLSFEEQEKEMDDKMKDLQDNMKYINEYEQTNILADQNRNIQLLTWINLVFLPLGLITGYFGMNFYAMGAPAEQHGILRWKYGQYFVWGLFLLCIIVVVILKLMIKG